MGESLPRTTAAHQGGVLQSHSQPGICQLPLHKGAGGVPFTPEYTGARDCHGNLAPQRCAERNRRRRLLARSSAHCLGMTEKVSLRTSAHAGVAILPSHLSLRTSSQTGVAILPAHLSLRTSAPPGFGLPTGEPKRSETGESLRVPIIQRFR